MKDNQITGKRIRKTCYEQYGMWICPPTNKLKYIPVEIYEEVREYFNGCTMATSYDGIYHIYKVTTQMKCKSNVNPTN